MAEKRPLIAFLGTGFMGQPMVRRLAQAGFEVTVWNRSLEKAETLRDSGVEIAKTPDDAVKGKDIVFTMLSDGSAVNQVLFEQGVADALTPGSMVIDMGSIKPSEARDHEKRLAEKDIAHLDAPVSGGTRGAEQGSLAIMVGGHEKDFERAGPLFDVFGRAILVGPPGAGQLSKLANQAIVATNIGGVAEALLMASAGGADPRAVRSALMGGFADSRVLQEHGERFLNRDFMPGGPLTLHIKDLNNILEVAHETGVDMPIAEKMLELFILVRDELDGGSFDHTALLLAVEARSKPNRLGSGPDKVPTA